MTFSALLIVFFTVFLAELGDKTQLATLLYASKGDHSPWLVFVAASAALITSTAVAVLLGTVASKYIAFLPLKLIAGIGFMLVGGWTILDYLKS